jgi:hypothetical protein
MLILQCFVEGNANYIGPIWMSQSHLYIVGVIVLGVNMYFIIGVISLGIYII